MRGGTCRRSASDAAAKLQLDAKVAIYGCDNSRYRPILAGSLLISRKPEEIQHLIGEGVSLYHPVHQLIASNLLTGAIQSPYGSMPGSARGQNKKGEDA
jgi:hypothetical protein